MYLAWEPRFTKAIEQLGSGEQSIRLGGIYALEKISQDEPKDYFSQFREVLCAFVRENARELHVVEGGRLPPKLPTDLQATLTVLGRNPPPEEIDQPVARIDWSGAYLEKADLTRAYLKGADLRFTYLEGASLTEAYLKGANLWQAGQGRPLQTR